MRYGAPRAERRLRVGLVVEPTEDALEQVLHRHEADRAGRGRPTRTSWACWARITDTASSSESPASTCTAGVVTVVTGAPGAARTMSRTWAMPTGSSPSRTTSRERPVSRETASASAQVAVVATATNARRPGRRHRSTGSCRGRWPRRARGAPAPRACRGPWTLARSSCSSLGPWTWASSFCGCTPTRRRQPLAIALSRLRTGRIDPREPAERQRQQHRRALGVGDGPRLRGHLADDHVQEDDDAHGEDHRRDVCRRLRARAAKVKHRREQRRRRRAWPGSRDRACTG